MIGALAQTTNLATCDCRLEQPMFQAVLGYLMKQQQKTQCGRISADAGIAMTRGMAVLCSMLEATYSTCKRDNVRPAAGCDNRTARSSL